MNTVQRLPFILTVALSMMSLLVIAQRTPPAGREQKKKSVLALIKRVIPTHANQFEIAFIESPAGNDRFEIDAKNGKIFLRGNNGVSIASALNYYLKNYAHCSITWNGTNLFLPKTLPLPKAKLVKTTPYTRRYYLNYCTFNYTMSWWNWDRWQKEIDWMALNGINMPLAVTGQNSVWKRVYKRFGLTDQELQGFFSGPAYFNWFWMGNLDAWGGPLPENFMIAHEELQKKILAQERALGMKPILPAFTGHVPAAFSSKFPDVKLKKTRWVNFPDVYILDPNEPMFTEIGRQFIEEQTRTYGTDHFYSADTFNENTPPTSDSIYLNDVSKKVYQSMALADPSATWIMQGWLFHHGATFWKTPQVKALLNAVPNDKMIILDLWSERHPVWNRTEAYYGKPWIWCMLHNFGGNINMYGLMDSVAHNPSAVLNNPSAGKLTGIGLTMEGIEQNPVMYELMLENVWRDSPIVLESWLQDYTVRRYGKENEDVQKGWDILRRTVYADTLTNGGPESIITARPTFSKNPGGTSTTALTYSTQELAKAWNYFINASSKLGSSDGFQFDVVDITRQVMANYASVIQQQLAEDYNNKNLAQFKIHSRAFLQLINDLDQLLATRKDFLLGKWLNAAKSWGTTNKEKQLYEQNARNLITLWGDKDSRLHEYACKQWSGLLNGFYKPRWEQFLGHVQTQLSANKPADFKVLEEQLKNWEWKWVNSHELYPDKPTGSPVMMARKMHEQYYRKVMSAE